MTKTPTAGDFKAMLVRAFNLFPDVEYTFNGVFANASRNHVREIDPFGYLRIACDLLEAAHQPNPTSCEVAEAVKHIQSYTKSGFTKYEKALETLIHAAQQCEVVEVNLGAALDMIKYLLPLAKGYVHANAGIRSTECIIEDAEAMLTSLRIVDAKKGE